jgi:hypothetical protein
MHLYDLHTDGEPEASTLRPDTFAAPEPLEDPSSILLRNARSLIRNACASVRTCAHRHLRVVYAVEFFLEYGLRQDTTQAPHQMPSDRAFTRGERATSVVDSAVSAVSADRVERDVPRLERGPERASGAPEQRFRPGNQLGHCEWLHEDNRRRYRGRRRDDGVHDEPGSRQRRPENLRDPVPRLRPRGDASTIPLICAASAAPSRQLWPIRIGL